MAVHGHGSVDPRAKGIGPLEAGWDQFARLKDNQLVVAMWPPTTAGERFAKKEDHSDSNPPGCRSSPHCGGVGTRFGKVSLNSPLGTPSRSTISNSLWAVRVVLNLIGEREDFEPKGSEFTEI